MSENMLQVKRIVKEGIALSYIEVESEWDGVVFDDFMPDSYTRERVNEFRVLKQNKGKDLKLKFSLTFDEYDRYGEYSDDVCNIEAVVTVRFNDMEHGEYFVSVKSEFDEPLKEFIDGCIGVEKNAFENMVRDSWKEQQVDYFLEYECKEKIGEQDFLYDLVDMVRDNVVSECVKCAGL